MNDKPENFPLMEIKAACEQIVAGGSFILQKWTCDGCGLRVTASNVNTLTERGHCGTCNHVTDLTVRGCNFMLIQSSNPNTTAADVEERLGLNDGIRH